MNIQLAQNVWRKGLMVLVNLALLAGLVWGALPAPPVNAASTGYVQEVAAGGWHTCALTSATSAYGVKCWGNDDNGQLGNGEANADSFVPVNVTGMTNGVSAIALGHHHTCALTNNGGVKCWGDNQYGQLGNGTALPNGADSSVPVDVSGLNSGVAAIAAGEFHTCAVMETTGEVRCWGRNTNGQLGNNATADSSTPVNVCAVAGCPTLLGSASAIAAGNFHTCAMTADGDAVCWGYNGDGQLGNGGSPVQSTIPVSVTLNSSSIVSHITAGAFHSCAVIDGGAMCWGDDQAGQLGDNSALADQNVPVGVNGLSADVAEIDSGYLHTCAVTTSGEILCWGDNEFGQLGDGTAPTDNHTPVAVSGLAGTANTASAGVYHSCALIDNGLVQCWGLNGDGQLGDGTNTQRNTPVNQLWMTTYATTTAINYGMCSGNGPCYSSPTTALNFTVGNVTYSGTVNVRSGTYNESLTLDKNATVIFEAGTTLNGDLTQSDGAMTIGNDFTLNGDLNQTSGTINAPAGTFFISGDLTRTGGLFNHNNGAVVFNGNGMQTLTGYTIFNNLTINSGSLLVLADQPAILDKFTNNGAVQETKAVGGATLFLDLWGSTQKYWGVWITPVSGSMGDTRVTIRGNQDCTTNPGDPVVRRCFEIVPTTPTTATLLFHYTTAELNGQTNGTMLVYHWNALNSEWNQETGIYARGGTEDAQYVQVTDVSNYSKFVLSSSLTAPTAIKLNTLAAAGGGWAFSLLLGLVAALGLTRRKQ